MSTDTEIDNDAELAAEPQWPAPWKRLHQQYIERYGNIRCERWHGPLVWVDGGIPKPLQFDDRVLTGLARKAAKVMRCVCAQCGRSGKMRHLDGDCRVRCGACQGKASLASQIRQLIAAAYADRAGPFDEYKVVWHEHELPLLLRECIPPYCWRATELPNGCELKYLGKEDVTTLVPWLSRLASVMQDRV